MESQMLLWQYVRDLSPLVVSRTTGVWGENKFDILGRKFACLAREKVVKVIRFWVEMFIYIKS